MVRLTEWRAVGSALAIALLAGIPSVPALGISPGAPTPFRVGASTVGCPAASPSGSLHDLSVFAANLTEFAGTDVELFASLPNGSPAVSYSWQTGDGVTSASTVGALRHVYASAGLYAVCVQALDARGTVHDNDAQLLLLPVGGSAATDLRGTLPILAGQIVANGSSHSAPTPFLQAGGSLSVALSAQLPVQQPATQLGIPTFSLSSNARSNLALSVLAANANGTSRARVVAASNAPAGFYELNFSIPATTPSNGTTLRTWANFTFSVVVGPGIGGVAVPQVGPVNRSRLTVVEVQPGAPASLDPAFVTSTAATEVLGNVYQTLIAVNRTAVGGRAGAFVPDLATCVPGSSLCRSLYGSSLVRGTNFTFVLNSRSRFYDRGTGASWGVWPTDVLFSLVRSLAFANAQCFGCSGGSALAESLLPPGNWSWDGAVHGPVNNTPSWIYGAFALNATGFCPPAANGSGGHGCVTIRLPANAANPAARRSLLELLAGPETASVEPCGWFSAPGRSAGVPYWTVGNVSGLGDRPCAPPGAPGAGVPPSSLSPSAFDAWQLAAAAPVPVGLIGLEAAGSGPFALTSIGPLGYNLSASPSYATDPYCSFDGCAPGPAGYIPAVQVAWLPTGSLVQSAVVNGSEDVAVFGGGASAAITADASLGLLTARSFPTLTLEVDGFNLAYNRTAALPVAAANLTAPSTLLADLNLRQFLIHTYPYDASNLLYAQGGLPTRGPAGGAIPTDSGRPVPRNISWPTGGPLGNPAVVGSAGWWWSRARADPSIASACTHTRPCSFLIAYPTGDGITARVDRAWAAAVVSISNLSVLPIVHSENYSQLALGAFSAVPGGQGPSVPSGLNLGSPVVDPSGPTTALFSPDSPLPYSDAVGSILAAYNSSSCSTSPAFWSGQSLPVPLACQGAAYGAMLSALQAAGQGPLGPVAILYYDEAEQIANDLGLYVYTGQSLRSVGLSPSIDPTSLEQSPLAVGDQGFAWDGVRWLATMASPLAIRGPAPSPGAVGGQNLTLTALVTGGTGGYGYNWSGLPPGCAVANVSILICVPNATGLFGVTLRVHDTSGAVVTASAQVLVTEPPGRRGRSSESRQDSGSRTTPPRGRPASTRSP